MNKLSKKILQLILGLLALWYGVAALQGEVFSWPGWWAALLGGAAAFFAVEAMIDMTDRYQRWR